MANHRKPDDEKVHAICGSVTIEIKNKVMREARDKGVTPARVVGGILGEWAEGKPGLEIDPRQESLAL